MTRRTYRCLHLERRRSIQPLCCGLRAGGVVSRPGELCLKFLRTLWVCNVAGGPQHYAATKPGETPLGLEEADRELKISPAEFDEVAAELGRTLDFFKVPEQEKEEVLSAFAAHKDEVTEGYSQ
jgi:hypothetical protein